MFNVKQTINNVQVNEFLEPTLRVGYFQKINKLPFVRPVPSIIYISGFKYLFAPSIVYNKVKYLYAITSNTFLFVGSITVWRECVWNKDFATRSFYCNFDNSPIFSLNLEFLLLISVKVNMIFRLTRTIFLANIILAKTQCPQSFKPARF